MGTVWQFEIEGDDEESKPLKRGSWQECFSQLIIEFADYAKYVFEAYKDDPTFRDAVLGRIADGFRHIDLDREYDRDFAVSAVGTTFRVKQA